jgi:hydroxylamine reductase (hybrid-cluster protein)
MNTDNTAHSEGSEPKEMVNSFLLRIISDLQRDNEELRNTLKEYNKAVDSSKNYQICDQSRAVWNKEFLPISALGETNINANQLQILDMDQFVKDNL